jgi:hypothetical protein
MTMHIVGPWLSTGGKKQGKQKFRNAEEAKRSRELKESWEKLLQRQGVPKEKSKPAKVQPLVYSLSVRKTPEIKSLPDTVKGAISSKQIPKYTGDKIIGIGTMHKSNAVPIFSDNEAKDISSMRR